MAESDSRFLPEPLSIWTPMSQAREATMSQIVIEYVTRARQVDKNSAHGQRLSLCRRHTTQVSNAPRQMRTACPNAKCKGQARKAKVVAYIGLDG